MTEPRYLNVNSPIEKGWDEITCDSCGDEVEPEVHEFVDMPIENDRFPNLVVAAHTHCAVEQGWRLRWPA